MTEPTHGSRASRPPTAPGVIDDVEAHLPADHWPLPELSETEPVKHEPTQAEWEAVHASPEYRELRRRFTRFAFPMTALFLVWYFAYVLMSVYFKDFMSTPFIGKLNIGMFLGLTQFLTTFVITWLYIRHANKKLDPIASELKAQLEGARS